MSKNPLDEIDFEGMNIDLGLPVPQRMENVTIKALPSYLRQDFNATYAIMDKALEQGSLSFKAPSLQAARAARLKIYRARQAQQIIFRDEEAGVKYDRISVGVNRHTFEVSLSLMPDLWEILRDMK